MLVAVLRCNHLVALPHFSPAPPFQTPTWSSPCWTPRAKRCPSARRPCAAASPTPPTRRRSSSRWRSSSWRRCRWWWRCSAGGAAWSPGRGWAGSPWATAAAARSSRATGQRWGRRRVSRSATGTRSQTLRRISKAGPPTRGSLDPGSCGRTAADVLTWARTGSAPSLYCQTVWTPYNLLFSEAEWLQGGWGVLKLQNTAKTQTETVQFPTGF